MATGVTTDFGRRLSVRRIERIQTISIVQVAAFALVAAAVMIPKLLPLLLPLLIAVPLLDNPDMRILALQRTDVSAVSLAFGAAVLAVAGYGVMAAHDTLEALLLVPAALALVAVTIAGVRAQPMLAAPTLTGLRRAVIAAFIVSAIYLMLEFISGLALIGFVYNKVPVIAGASKYTFIFDEQGRELVRRHVLNRNVGVLALLLWPVVLLALLEIRRGAMQLWVLPLLLVPATAAVMLSAHETSKVALVVSLVVMMVARVAPRAALAAVAAAWIGVNVAMVPMVRTAYDSGLQLDASLTGSARARITIWNFTAKRIGSSWLLGKGADSVRQDDMRMKPIYVRGESGMARTGRHSHNIYLQMWYEFGAAGVALFTIAGLLVLGAIRRIESRSVPLALATFTSAMVMMAFSWGLWQHWYVAALGMSALLFAVGACPRPAAETAASGKQAAKRWHGAEVVA